MEVKGNTRGFSLKFLIEKDSVFIDVHNWEACYIVIVLSIYGIILFPNLDNFVDMTAICIFLTNNPVPTLLVDVSYKINLRNERIWGMIICCAPLLYIWLLTRFPKMTLHRASRHYYLALEDGVL